MSSNASPALVGLDGLPLMDRRLLMAGGLATVAMAGGARAQEAFPSRPLMIMAPANPGGGTDQIARLIRSAVMAEHLSPRPMEVINRGGAGGAIGLAELVSRHHGDPHMIMASGSSTISATVAQNSPFRMGDALPLARMTTDPMVVAVPAASPYKTIQEFMAAFRRNPDSVTWCGGSAAGLDHLLVGLVTEACGVTAEKLRYIAYAGSGAASTALLGGQVTAGSSGYSEWRGLADSGRVRVLASASPERIPDRDIPTFREAGFDLVLSNWRGVFLPPGLRPEHIAWWESLIERMHASQTWQTYLTKNGWVDGYIRRAEFVQTVKDDQVRYTAILNHLHIGGSGGGSGGASVIGPYTVPAIVGVAGGAALVATVVEARRHKGEAIVPAAAEDDDDGGGPLPIWKRFFYGAGLSLAYIGALALVGFLIATPIFVMGLSLLMGSVTGDGWKKKMAISAVSSVVMALAVWLLFTRLLYVNLP